MTDTKVLKRLPKKGKISGVCAGIAEYFDMDVSIIRIIFVVLAFAAGSTIIIYIVLAIVLPVAGEDDKKKSLDEKIERFGEELTTGKENKEVRYFFGISLLAIGTWLLLGQFLPEVFAFRWDVFWPIVLIVLGVFIIFKKKD
jgi:phage shock protein C